MNGNYLLFFVIIYEEEFSSMTLNIKWAKIIPLPTFCYPILAKTNGRPTIITYFPTPQPCLPIRLELPVVVPIIP